MQRASLSNVFAVLLLTAATLSSGTALAANQAPAKNQAPVMEAVPTANGEAPRTRIRTPQSAPAPTKNIYETLRANKDASEFIKMVDEAEMSGELSGSPSNPDLVISIFVPTNKAMGDISPDAMKRIRVSKGNMQSFVEYHVINNTIVTTGTLKGRKSTPASASGETLTLDGTDKKNPPKINDAVLVGSEISATNGVIHMVSTAVVPPSVLLSPKTQPKAAEAPPPPPPPPKSAIAATTTATAAKLTTTASGFAPPATGDVPAAGFSAPSSLTTTATGAPNVNATASPVPATTAPPSTPAAAAQAPAGDDKGTTLFGHKFSW